VFSHVEDTVILPYRGDADEIEFESPIELFKEHDLNSSSAFSAWMGTKLRKLRMQQNLVGRVINKLDPPKTKERQIEEQYEMEFKCINIGEIQGEDKLGVSRTLKDCQDIELFE
jgi:hypothetical protein